MLQKDQCVVAENVEFFFSTCGEKRKGTSFIILTGSSISDASNTACVFLYRHVPAADETQAELWAVFAIDDGTQHYGVSRKTTSWSTLTPPDDIDTTNNRRYKLNAASLHGKMMLCYRSVGGVDRMHCWDGTSLRRVGIIAPSAAPTASNTGSGSFTGTRYYRVRYIVMSGSTILRRSEPSPQLQFAPSGSGSGAVVTKPAATSPSEGETHWELEASINNADWYRIATTAVATTSVTDTILAFTVGYNVPTNGALSDDIGNYTLPISSKFVVTDEDRFLFLGSWEQPTLASTVFWTPVSNDPGVGNDERVPIETTNSINLDGSDGGEITGGTRSINGYIFVFKLSRIYKLWRTNNANQAYTSLCLTKSMGAIPGSVVEGLDQTGNPCVNFVDPHLGPCRIGVNGLETTGYDIQNTTKSVNVDANLVCTGIYYPDKHQLLYKIATGSALTPNLGITCQVSHQKSTPDKGARGGWSTWSSGRSSSAYTMCLFSTNIDAGTNRSLKLVPFIGLPVLAGDRNLIQMTDQGGTDSGSSYYALIKSRPELINNLLAKGGGMAGNFVATAASGVAVDFALLRDFGIDASPTVVPAISLTPTSTETQVVRPLDNLFQSEGYVMEIYFGDIEGIDQGLWQINLVVVKMNDEESL